MKKLLSLLLLCGSLHAETIEFVVPATPGGPDDVSARKIIKEIETNSKLSVAVEYKAGASHNIGYSYIASSNKPTLFLATNQIIKNKDMNAIGYPDKITEVVEPIFYMGDFSNIMFVNSKSSIYTIDDLILVSKQRDINFGHGGIGTYSHTSMEKVCGSVLKCLTVPYKGGGAGLIDILNNTIDTYSFASYGAEAVLDNQNYRPIMVFSNTKHEIYNVPTLPKELKRLEVKNWIMLFGKNLSTQDKTNIINILKNRSNKFYNEFGVWYEYKDPKIIWNKELRN